MLDVALLGTGGMMPIPDRFLTSMLLRINGRLMLVDCGEGTQVTMKQNGWGFKNLDLICFTHFHADHIAGLPGLLLTVGNSGRTETITLIGPKGLSNVVKNLLVIAPELPFDIKYIEIEKNLTDFKVSEFSISTISLDHRLACYGYSVYVRRKGRFDVEKAKALEIPINVWTPLQNKDEVEFEGKTYLSEWVLGEDRKGIKVSYVTDTRPVSGLSDFVRDSDLFIAEGIYGDDEKLPKAMEYKHMLFSEAALVSKNGGVKELWLTHFSPSLTDPSEYISVAKDIFQNSRPGEDRLKKTIMFED